MHRILLNEPDPAELFTREQLRAALAEVKARSRMSLTQLASRSEELTLANRGRTFGSGRRRLVPLTRTNISGFTTGGRERSQLPGEDALVTFLLTCGIAPGGWGGGLAALGGAGVSRRA